jgi:hypothetical protein
MCEQGVRMWSGNRAIDGVHRVSSKSEGNHILIEKRTIGNGWNQAGARDENEKVAETRDATRELEVSHHVSRPSSLVHRGWPRNASVVKLLLSLALRKFVRIGDFLMRFHFSICRSGDRSLIAFPPLHGIRPRILVCMAGQIGELRTIGRWQPRLRSPFGFHVYSINQRYLPPETKDRFHKKGLANICGSQEFSTISRTKQITCSSSQRSERDSSK